MSTHAQNVGAATPDGFWNPSLVCSNIRPKLPEYPGRLSLNSFAVFLSSPAAAYLFPPLLPLQLEVER